MLELKSAIRQPTEAVRGFKKRRRVTFNGRFGHSLLLLDLCPRSQ